MADTTATPTPEETVTPPTSEPTNTNEQLVLKTIADIDGKPAKTEGTSTDNQSEVIATLQAELAKVKEMYNTALVENNKLYQRITTPTPPAESPTKAVDELLGAFKY